MLRRQQLPFFLPSFLPSSFSPHSFSFNAVVIHSHCSLHVAAYLPLLLLQGRRVCCGFPLLPTWVILGGKNDRIIITATANHSLGPTGGFRLIAVSRMQGGVTHAQEIAAD
ncbi:hypothetical protein K440DRAFT_372068 [Wilcoxina mikolae CBS 423.85]|nr:hypothetical protein K440DRAFT_372068 [Wilcoxina mikolae CBS 423.85]